MKVNIRSLQSGGPALPFVDYMPFTGVAGADTSTGVAGDSASSKSKSGGSNDIGLKDILNLVKEMNVLPSDAEKIIRNIRSMYQEQNLFNNGQLSADQIMTTYLSALKGLNDAKYNVDQAKKIRDNLMSEGSLHDIAIKDDGRLIIQNTSDGSISYLTVDQFNYINKENPGKYEALTNANLLDYRANDSNFAFKNDILRLASNGISEKTVTEMLQRALKDVGMTTLKQEGYSEKAGKKIIGGLEQLQAAFSDGMDIEGVYKQSYENKEQQEQIEAAMNYIWRSMPNNAKTWLKFKSGDTDNSETGAKKLIAELMFAHNSPTTEYNLQRVGNGNGDGSGAGGGTDDIKTTFLGQIQRREGGHEGTLLINLGGKYSNTTMSMNGTVYEAMLDPNFKVIEPTNMFDLMQRSGLVGIKNGAIYFGDKQVNVEDLKNIAFTGESSMRVDIPVNEAGAPDFDLFKEFTEMQDEAKMNGNTPEAIKKALDNHPSVARLYKDGKPDMNKFRPYIMIKGMTTDSLSPSVKDNNFVNEIDPDQRLYDSLRQTLAVKGPDGKAVIPDIDDYGFSESIFKGWGEWINGYDHIYRGSVFIPINMSKSASQMYGGNDVTQSKADKLELEHQLKNTPYNPTTSADLLKNN